MGTDGITFVGMDAHKKAINVAMLLPGRKDPVEWQVANEPAAVRRLAKKLEREGAGEVRCCYEAGPCGYVLQRQLHQAGGLVCEVVAPSLIPVKPGERIKTDRRDARKLAELLKAELLTEVHAPSINEEATRDLSRCREDAQEDLGRARQRMGKFLLRRGLVFTVSKRAWGKLHRQWLRGLTFEPTDDRAVFGDYLIAIEQLEERLRTLETQADRQRAARSVSRTGRLAAVFSGYRHGDRDDAGRGAPRLSAISKRARADGVPGAGAKRVLER